ncbi:MAG: SPOR domain-containing protein [Muribaculaceae bacterium]|nr:SPOR domain-containing protein [Muribaculaceae bacterium]
MSIHGYSAVIAAVLMAIPCIARGETPKVMQLIEQDSIITIVQPASLENRLIGKAVAGDSVAGELEKVDSVEPVTVVTGGYRVQVFADNNARTAKDEARAKAMAIREQLPHLATYVTYEAPYWRLRVGDFRSESDAEAAAAEIKHYFPNISREVRVVRDRINR